MFWENRPVRYMKKNYSKFLKDLIQHSGKPISEIARTLDYDPSNFTKFFKRFTGATPTEYRKVKTEKLTF